jgi:hypothetical protein
MVKKLKSRSPSASIAKAVLAKRKARLQLKNAAAKVEAAARKKGGYGRNTVSIYDAPKGGIEKSPAYRKICTRCEIKNGKPIAPELRDGAPLKGGFPIKKYPVNVLVDGQRAPWLPDDWAQVIKNTGPGGTYLGWMSPEGKFAYHRKGYTGSIHEILGRILTVQDGINGMKRTVSNILKPGADKAFLQDCLSASERRCIPPASAFHFCVVSARRANDDAGQYCIMIVEHLCRQAGVKPTWYVDKDSLEDYKKLGLIAKVGGKLTPARNMALDDAKKKRLICVQVSDDIGKWIYHDCAKQDFRGETGFTKANKALLGTKKHIISPLAAAQFMAAKMRADPKKPKLAGIFPTANAAMTLGAEEFGYHHFILGDFFVAEYSSPCRFDNTMTLKEDYDYTCSHIKTHGAVLRCNRMFLQVKHKSNAGGAVDARDNAGKKERENIAILQRKWPGVFRINGRRKGATGSEVTMNWNGYGKTGEQKDRKSPKTKASAAQAKGSSMKVMKHKLKVKNLAKLATTFPLDAVLRFVKQDHKSNYINKRCGRFNGKPIRECLGTKYKDVHGIEKSYGYSDLKYDVAGGSLEVTKKVRKA